MEFSWVGKRGNDVERHIPRLTTFEKFNGQPFTAPHLVLSHWIDTLFVSEPLQPPTHVQRDIPENGEHLHRRTLRHRCFCSRRYPGPRCTSERSSTRLRELERAFWRIDIPSFVLERQWKIVIRALFIVIPCSTSDYDRLDAIELLLKLYRKLRTSCWEDMRAWLTTYFLCDYVQDEPCQRLWMEINGNL